MKAVILRCKKCGKIKKFGAWVQPSKKTEQEIELKVANGEAMYYLIVCDKCAKK